MTNPVSFGHGNKVKALAVGKRSSVDVIGSRKASGTILFAGNLSADEVVTINGVDFVADTDFVIGAGLTDTLDNLVTALEGSADEDVSVASYSKVGSNDTLQVLYDTAGDAGNEFTLATDAAGATLSGATLDGGYDADALDPDEAGVFNLISKTGTVDQDTNFVLPDGKTVGQMITLYFKTAGANSDAVVAGTFTGGTSLTFDAAKERALLQWLGGEWLPLVNTATLA